MCALDAFMHIGFVWHQFVHCFELLKTHLNFTRELRTMLWSTAYRFSMKWKDLNLVGYFHTGINCNRNWNKIENLINFTLISSFFCFPFWRELFLLSFRLVILLSLFRLHFYPHLVKCRWWQTNLILLMKKVMHWDYQRHGKILNNFDLTESVWKKFTIGIVIGFIRIILKWPIVIGECVFIFHI